MMITKDKSNREIDWILIPSGHYKKINKTKKEDLSCDFCGGIDFWACMKDTDFKNKNTEWVAFCNHCSTMTTRARGSGEDYSDRFMVKSKSGSWESFCNENNIVGKYQNVRFDRLEDHEEERIIFMMEYAKQPKTFLKIKGDPGVGKTYAALAICELFVKTHDSKCKFITERSLHEEWIASFAEKHTDSFCRKMSNYPLLVIDDFGVDLSKEKERYGDNYKETLKDILDNRMSSEKGTVITTNLTDDFAFQKYCRERIMDRIKKGEEIYIQGKSKR